MLIILDETLASELESAGPLSTSVLCALTVCAQQVREGKHILFAERKVYRRLRAFYKDLDSRSASVLVRAEDRLPQLGGVNKFSIRALRLVANHESLHPFRVVEGHREEVVLPVKAIESNSSLLNSPILMVENLNDGKCYVKIVQSVVNSRVMPDLAWLRGVPLQYEIAPGGGNTLHDLFSYHKARRDRLGVAVADSDSRYPDSKFGATALALLEATDAKPVSPLLESHVIGVRTIENCIPRDELRSIFAEIDPAQLKVFEEIELKFSKSPYWRYVPMKSGVRCFELGQASEESVFWTELLGANSCASMLRCAKKRECSSYVLRPLSDKALARAASRSGFFSITENCLDGVVDTWRRLVILLYSVFCGSERITVL